VKAVVQQAPFFFRPAENVLEKIIMSDRPVFAGFNMFPSFSGAGVGLKTGFFKYTYFVYLKK